MFKALARLRLLIGAGPDGGGAPGSAGQTTVDTFIDTDVANYTISDGTGFNDVGFSISVPSVDPDTIDWDARVSFVFLEGTQNNTQLQGRLIADPGGADETVLSITPVLTIGNTPTDGLQSFYTALAAAYPFSGTTIIAVEVECTNGSVSVQNGRNGNISEFTLQAFRRGS